MKIYGIAKVINTNCCKKCITNIEKTFLYKNKALKYIEDNKNKNYNFEIVEIKIPEIN